MRHGKTFNHLGRTSSHRKALLANMASSLILKKRIETTLAKAKELRKYVEPLLTKSKEDTTHSRRTVFAYLKNKESVKELFGDVANKIAERPGGYTRIIKLGNRLGDAAEICIIELVDYNETMLSAKAEVKKTRRSRRGGKGKTETTSVQTVTSNVETVAEPAVEQSDEITTALNLAEPEVTSTEIQTTEPENNTGIEDATDEKKDA